MRRKSSHPVITTALFSTGLLLGCEMPSNTSQSALSSDLPEGVLSSSDESALKGGQADANRNRACYVERFEQPQDAVTNAVDVLFVADSSASLEDEKQKIADGIGSFVSSLPRGADVQFAVMPSHGSHSRHSGHLYTYAGVGKPVFSLRKASLATVRSQLKFTLTHLPSDPFTSGGEVGMKSVLTALEPGHLSENRAKGFFRPGAALAVIFISDENDICATYPAGVKPVPSYRNVEAKAKASECKDVSAERVVDELQSLQGDRPLLIGAIVYDDLKTVPKRGEDEFGYGYVDMVKLSNGISLDIAKGHYDEGLASVGTLMGARMQLKTEFKLARKHVDPRTVRVTVDGQDVPFAYDFAKRIVRLTGDAGRAQSVIEVSYCQFKSACDEKSGLGLGHLFAIGKGHEKHDDDDWSWEDCVTPVPSPSGSPTPSPSVTPSPTTTVVPSPTPSSTVSPEPSSTVGPEPTVTPDPTVTPEPTSTVTPDPTATPEPTASPEPTSTVTPDPTTTPDPTDPNGGVDPEPTASPSPTPSSTPCVGLSCGGGVIGL